MVIRLIMLLVFVASADGTLENGLDDTSRSTRRLAAYGLSPRDSAGCTAVLRKYSDGSVSFVGCPTYSCYQDECNAYESESLISCRCEKVADGGYLCLSVVAQNPITGEVTGWECILQQCPGTCVENSEPVVGPNDPPADFYACDCDS